MNPAFVQPWVDRFGSIYREAPLSQVPWFTAAPGLKVIQAVVDGLIPRGCSVVDMGCGPGCDAVFLATCGASVTGIDVSEAALARARQLANWAGVSVDFQCASILETGLPGASADVVNDSFVFHNVAYSARISYADEIHRLLRPSGHFLLSAFSDRMLAGSGPRRITGTDIFATFEPARFQCRTLELYRNVPTEARPEQVHWFAVFRRI